MHESLFPLKDAEGEREREREREREGLPPSLPHSLTSIAPSFPLALCGLWCLPKMLIPQDKLVSFSILRNEACGFSYCSCLVRENKKHHTVRLKTS